MRDMLQLDQNLLRLQKAFHENLSKEERSMMLKDHRREDLSSAKDKYQRRFSDKYPVQHKYQKKSRDPKISTYNCGVDRWSRKLELCATDMTAGVE